MKKYFSLLMIVAVIILSGCANQGRILITDDDAEYVVSVLGGNDFFEPVAGTYLVTEKGGILSTTISFRISKKFNHPDFVVEDFYLEPYDKNDNCLKINSERVEFKTENKQVAYKKLLQASVGDVLKMKFNYTLADKNQAKELLEAIVSCGVTLDVEEPEEPEEPEEKEEKLAPSKSSTNWDKVLDSYEKYMDNYIAVLKKVNDGDMNAYSDMATLLEQCNELNEQLENASDDMTAAQMARFQKITAKMTEAAAQL